MNTLTDDEVFAVRTACADPARPYIANGDGNVAQLIYDATRAELHAALQAKNPMPTHDNPKTAFALQTAHSTELWELTDQLLVKAGITR